MINMVDEDDFDEEEVRPDRCDRCLRVVSNLERICSDPCLIGVIVFIILIAILYFSLRFWEKKVIEFFLK